MFNPQPKPISEPKKKRKRIKAVGVKRERQLKKYSHNRKKYLYEHVSCECCKKKPSNEIHHKAGRSGDMLCDINHFLAVCRTCHERIELNPVWAKENGYSTTRL